ncbi:MAG: peptidoglycan DD-metalloendopeptidase family protein, partial [Paracoccaceae bacterium]|nr:peptidoglycan DD-metalloendopeptidase family protein [Paracoccaceae bacterium]
ASADTDPRQAAAAATGLLEDAAVSLLLAETARDRVRALTRAVKGYEAALAAMRVGLRQVAVREAQMVQDINRREGSIAQLLGVLQTIVRTPAPNVLLHPSGPVGTVRAAILLADITPGLQAQAQALRRNLDEVTALRQLQQQASDHLQKGLLGAQVARTKLSQAMSGRRDLPKRFVEDPLQTAILIAATETLAAFANSVGLIATKELSAALPDISGQKGRLAMPVRGRLLRYKDEPDAAGVIRPGIVLATRPRALVTAPAGATIRYRGPLLDYGQVVILEPQKDTLFVLAGLAQVYGDTGQVVSAGTPLGLMGGDTPQIGAIMSQSKDWAGTDRTETLYIEVRQGNSPVDPLDWFTSQKD